MSEHACTSATAGCYRCELGQDEVRAALTDALTEAASDARANSYNGMNEWYDALADVFADGMGSAIAKGDMAVWPVSLTLLGRLAQAYLDNEQERAEADQYAREMGWNCNNGCTTTQPHGPDRAPETDRSED